MRKLLVFVIASMLLIPFGCGKETANKEVVVPKAEQKLAKMGAADVKEINTNKPTYDRMEIEDRGKAYSVEMFQDRKISFESNFKGQILLLSPDGEELMTVNGKNKYYLPAKDGKYFVWLKNNAIPSDYYIIIKTFNKAAFNADADEKPGTKIDKDGVITGVVDSKTDPVDYYYFSVLADYDVRLYHDNADVDVVLMNKYNEETPTVKNKPATLFIMDAQDLYIKVTAKEGKISTPYEINLKRIKNDL